MSEMAEKQLVESGYDRMAEQYLATKDVEEPTTLAALEKLASTLPTEATVLDLGCGAGVPVTRWLARRFAVTGADVSGRQLELARNNAPGATFIKADMTELNFPPETFDAIVAFHSIIHVPRTRHRALLNDVYRWLKPGGIFLATLALTEWEGEEEDWEGWGAPMWWSHYDENTNLKMLREAGFDIESAEPRTTGGPQGDEAWLWISARKRTWEVEE